MRDARSISPMQTRLWIPQFLWFLGLLLRAFGGLIHLLLIAALVVVIYRLLTGRKLFITNANEADLFVVFATVNPEAGYRGITALNSPNANQVSVYPADAPAA